MSNEPDKVYVGKNLKSLQTSPKPAAYTKVVFKKDDGTTVEYGNDTGLSIETECPWANSSIAQSVLSMVNNLSYQPYSANGAAVDPAAEIGDAINVHGVHSGIYKMNRKFGRHSSTNTAAPQRSEANSEILHQTEADRRYRRKISGKKLIDNSILESKYGAGSVSYPKVAFPETLDQVGVNKSDIQALQNVFAGLVSANTIWVSNLFLTHGGTRRRLYPTTININGAATAVVTWRNE